MIKIVTIGDETYAKLKYKNTTVYAGVYTHNSIVYFTIVDNDLNGDITQFNKEASYYTLVSLIRQYYKEVKKQEFYH